MTRGGRRLLVTVGLAVALGAAAPSPAAACPSCKTALDTDQRWQSAFNASVLFMMSMPFAVAAVVGGALYRAHRKKQRELDAAEPPPAG